MTVRGRAARLAVGLLAAGVVLAASSPADAQARSGSLVVGVVHRNDATLARIDGDRALTVAWTGVVGGWHRLTGPISLDARLELFGVTLRSRGGASDSVRVHLGPELGVVVDPTSGALAGLLRGVRVALGVDFDATIAGASGEVVVPRVSIGWVDVVAVGPGHFPYRPLRVEAALTWSPGTVLVTLAAGVESVPLARE